MTTTKWDATEFLGDEELLLAYLEEAFETGDTKLIQKALGNIARARNITQIAKDSALSRETIYKALSAEGDPRFSTLMKVSKALGLKLQVAPHYA